MPDFAPHPRIPYDTSLIESVATMLDLRKPNRNALDIVVSELASADGEPFTGVCDLATAVGKTYLAAGLLDYLAGTGVRNFLFVVPNKTLYTKTIDNFTTGTKRSLLPYMASEPVVIHPGNFNASWVASAMDDPNQTKLYVFNIQQLIEPKRNAGKDNAGRKVRDTDNENLGTSLYEALREQSDLVVFSDEHHLYAEKAAAFNAAITDLDAMAVIGLTATPDDTQVDDVVYHYSLAQAIADQLVKTPCIVGRTDDRSDTETRLLDGIELLKEKKRQADAYAEANNTHTVNPVMLVVARTIEDADDVADRLRQANMFDDDASVLVIHSEASDEDLEKLAAVEDADSPVRAIVSVQMLGVGWDVKNVYVILSLRPSVSDALTEQTLGRGLRLPWGVYTNNEWLDTVEVLAHEQYKKLLEKTDSILEGLVSDGTVQAEKAEKARKRAAAKRAAQEYDRKQRAKQIAEETPASPTEPESGSTSQGEAIAEKIEEEIEEDDFDWILDEQNLEPSDWFEQGDDGIPVVNEKPLISSIEDRKKEAAAESESIDKNKVVVARTDITITVPVVVATATPKMLNLSKLNDDVFEELGRRVAEGEITQLLREILNVVHEGDREVLQPKVATGLVAATPTFTFDVQQELVDAILYSDFVPSTSPNARAASRLAKAVIKGVGDEDAIASELGAVKRMVLRKIEEAYESLDPDYEYTTSSEPFDKSKGNYRPVEPNRHAAFKTSFAYSGWGRSFYPIVWFDSKPERDTANILDLDARVKVWVRLQRGDTPIPWDGGNYQPDFLVKTVDGKQYMIEVKADKDLDSAEVHAKRDAAMLWANLVADAGLGEWKYLLVPESVVESAKSLQHLMNGSRKS